MTKIGRPKKDDALTAAERQKQYRERQKAKRASGELEQTPEQYRARAKKLELDLIDARSTIAALQPALMRANEQVLAQQRRIDEFDAEMKKTDQQLREAWDEEEKSASQFHYALSEVAELVRRGSSGGIDYQHELNELLRRYGYERGEEDDSECDEKLLRDFP